MTSAPSSSSSKQPPPPHLFLHVDTTNSSAASSSSRLPRPTGGGGCGQNHQACAACKYQRRKCNPDCPLARYFPADQQRRFLNAHRLFGVSNIQKTLRRIDPELGPEAMHTLIYQSEARAADPVHGCLRIIRHLERQLEFTQAQLADVYQQIDIYRRHAAADNGGDPGQDDGAAAAMDAIYAGAGVVFQHDHHQQEYHPPPPAHQLYDYFCYDEAAAAGDEATSQDATSVQQYGYADAAGVKAGSPVSLGEQLEQHCQIEAAAAPFVDAFDVKPHQVLPATTMEHHGHAVGVEQPEECVNAALKYDGGDQQMAEPAARCHLELGFSSF